MSSCSNFVSAIGSILVSLTVPPESCSSSPTRSSASSISPETEFRKERNAVEALEVASVSSVSLCSLRRVFSVVGLATICSKGLKLEVGRLRAFRWPETNPCDSEFCESEPPEPPEPREPKELSEARPLQTSLPALEPWPRFWREKWEGLLPFLLQLLPASFLSSLVWTAAESVKMYGLSTAEWATMINSHKRMIV